MKIYNKFIVTSTYGITRLSFNEQEMFKKLSKKANKFAGKSRAKYYVVNINEKFAPAIKELIKAYCN